MKELTTNTFCQVVTDWVKTQPIPASASAMRAVVRMEDLYQSNYEGMADAVPVGFGCLFVKSREKQVDVAMRVFITQENLLKTGLHTNAVDVPIGRIKRKRVRDDSSGRLTTVFDSVIPAREVDGKTMREVIQMGVDEVTSLRLEAISSVQTIEDIVARCNMSEGDQILLHSAFLSVYEECGLTGLIPYRGFNESRKCWERSPLNPAARRPFLDVMAHYEQAHQAKRLKWADVGIAVAHWLNELLDSNAVICAPAQKGSKWHLTVYGVKKEQMPAFAETLQAMAPKDSYVTWSGDPTDATIYTVPQPIAEQLVLKVYGIEGNLQSSKADDVLWLYMASDSVCGEE